MSDRLREMLSKCFITANSTPEGKYFVQINMPTLHEMHELHREIVSPGTSRKQKLEQAPRPIPAAEFRAAFEPERQPYNELLDELTAEFKAGFAEDYRKKTAPVNPEPDWRPISFAPRNPEKPIRVRLQRFRFEKQIPEEITVCFGETRFNNRPLTGWHYNDTENHIERWYQDDDFVGWMVIDEQ
jgi:hypothetical protein